MYKQIKVSMLRSLALIITSLFITSCQKYDTGNYFSSIEQLTLSKAIINQDTDEISSLINSGTAIDTKGNNGITPLMWALLNKKKTSYEFLLVNGADPNLQMTSGDWKGQSTISLSAMSRHPWFLETALKHGGDPNLVNPKKGRTPIFEAIEYKEKSLWWGKDPSTEKVLLLIKANADLNFQDKAGWTPMMTATIANRYDIVYTLLKNGADPTLETKTGDNLIKLINKIRTDPQSELYQWRTKVIEEINKKRA
jgi:ankyrin repeat protein